MHSSRMRIAHELTIFLGGSALARGRGGSALAGGSAFVGGLPWQRMCALAGDSTLAGQAALPGGSALPRVVCLAWRADPPPELKRQMPVKT